MSKIQFTGTATQPQCNRNFCQFNKDQYCISVHPAISKRTLIGKQEDASVSKCLIVYRCQIFTFNVIYEINIFRCDGCVSNNVRIYITSLYRDGWDSYFCFQVF